MKDQEKRTDAQIYELVYKSIDYPLDDNKLYTPLQVGASRTKNDIVPTKDNTGINISSFNNFYSETTGTYWIWKNVSKSLDYVGQCQYRRRLLLQEDTDFKSILGKDKIIVNAPLMFGKTLKSHMEMVHPQIDTKILSEIISQKFSEYMDSYTKNFVNGNVLFYSTSYVMPVERFNEYCNFLFGVLGYYSDYFGLDDPNTLRRYVEKKISESIYLLKNTDINYQSLIGGFLQERLASIYILKTFKDNEILTKDFTLMEGLKY